MTGAVYPFEDAYTRRVLFAVEVLDGVTLARVTNGLTVKAIGLRREAIVNASGLFVWLEEGNLAPQRVDIDPGALPYLSAALPPPPLAVPAPPPAAQRPPLIQVELAPRTGYSFAAGVTGVRGTLISQRNQIPPMPLAGIPVWLRWIDDDAPGTVWMDAPIRSRTDSSGDFAAVLRLTPSQVARRDASGRLRVRVRAINAGDEKESGDFTLPEGRVTTVAAEEPPLPLARPFAWNEFTP